MQPLAKSDNKLWSLSSIMHSMKSYSSQQILLNICRTNRRSN
nr:hypothetical protein [Tychonema sp. BBK16]